MRRSVAAVTIVFAAIVVPYFLSAILILPVGAADWLLRLTPAAAFAVQQATPQYPQVQAYYAPVSGFYPLAPWAGFAVLCAWTAGRSSAAPSTCCAGGTREPTLRTGAGGAARGVDQAADAAGHRLAAGRRGRGHDRGRRGRGRRVTCPSGGCRPIRPSSA